MKKVHSPNQRITVWIRLRDVLLLQKFYQVREFRIWQKDNFLFQQTLFTGVTGKRASLAISLNYLIRQVANIILWKTASQYPIGDSVIYLKGPF